MRFKARDGLELEGMLIHPVGGQASDAPLILTVHGGPEAHYSNKWITSYSLPGQVAAARGFAVFYPNYRGSTGRGIVFSILSQGDAAGKSSTISLMPSITWLRKAWSIATVLASPVVPTGVRFRLGRDLLHRSIRGRGDVRRH